MGWIIVAVGLLMIAAGVKFTLDRRRAAAALKASKERAASATLKRYEEWERQTLRKLLKLKPGDTFVYDMRRYVVRCALRFGAINSPASRFRFVLEREDQTLLLDVQSYTAGADPDAWLLHPIRYPGRKPIRGEVIEVVHNGMHFEPVAWGEDVLFVVGAETQLGPVAFCRAYGSDAQNTDITLEFEEVDGQLCVYRGVELQPSLARVS